MNLFYHTKYIYNVCSLIYEIHCFLLFWKICGCFGINEDILFEIIVVGKQYKVLKSHQWPWVGCLCIGVSDRRNSHMIPSQSSPQNKLGITSKFQMIFFFLWHMPQGSFLLNSLSFHMYSENSVHLSLHFCSVQSTVRVQIYLKISLAYIMCSINIYSANGLCYSLMIQFYKEASQLRI